MDEPKDGDSLEEVETLEEAEALEEVRELGVPGPSEAALSLLEEPAVRTWTESYSTSIVPVFLLDRDLAIIWANSRFESLFGEKDAYLGTPVNAFFGDSLPRDEQMQLRRHLISEERGHSWRGKIERKGREELSVLGNLLVLPVYAPGVRRTEPLFYMVVLDDVTKEHNKLLRDTYNSLLEASRLKDNDTGNHIFRVNSYSRALAEEMLGHPGYQEIDRQFMENIGYLAAMHDVGKIGTSDNILNKEGPLEDWEWAIMKEHTINGAFLLSSHPVPMVKDIALFHHEKWNGSGYPYAISKDMIPVCARIVAIADVYDALRMKRSYKDAYPHDKAVDVMLEGKGIHFDPVLLDNFRDTQEGFQKIFEELED